MSTHGETTPAAGETKPLIETLGQAAAEIKRLYSSLGKVAVDLTPQYLEQRLAGEEDVTWTFPRVGFLRRPTPLLDDVVRHNGAILLGAGYNMWSSLLTEYRLSESALLVPGDGEAFVKTSAVTVHRPGRGYNPGDEYVAVGDSVLKAGHDYYGSMPSTGSDGKLAWSVPREFVNATFQPMTEVDSALLKVIDTMRAYEPVAEPAL